MILTMKPVHNILLICVFAALVLFASLRIPGEWHMIIPTEWRLTHWLFSYEFGFIKRGFVGTIIYLFTAHPSYYLLSILSLTAHLVATYTLVFYLLRRLSPVNFPRFIFTALFLASSATLQHLTWNLGRFDHFGVVILIASLLILERGPYQGKWFIIPLCAAGILIHEAFFLLFFPLIFTASLYAIKESPAQKIFSISLAASSLTVLFLTTQFGSMEALNKESYLAYLHGKTNFSPDESSVMVLYRGFRENVAYTLSAFFTPETLYNHITLLAWQLPVVVALYLFLRSLYRKACEIKENFYYILLAAASFSPLALYIVGRDFYRWIAVIMLNFFIIILFLSQKKTYLQCLEETASNYRLLIIVSVVISILAGPIGIEKAHPYKLIGLLTNLP